MTTIEAGLVSRLRNKIGDNPTIIVTNPITGASYNSGIVTVTTQNNHNLEDGYRLLIKGILGMTDLNNSFNIFNTSNTTFDVALTTSQTYSSAGLYDIQETDKQIWSDNEILEALDSAVVQVFKGKKVLADVSLFEIEFVLVRTNADLIFQLAIDSARYSRYILKDVNAKKVDPSEFLKAVEALEKRLKSMFEELDDSDAGSVVFQSVIRIEDREENILIPTEMESDITVPDFALSSVATGVQVDIYYKFIPSYKSHFIKQIDDVGAENIIKELYSVATENFIDTTVVSGKTYKYVLFVRTLNGALFSKEKSISYAAP